MDTRVLRAVENKKAVARWVDNQRACLLRVKRYLDFIYVDERIKVMIRWLETEIDGRIVAVESILDALLTVPGELVPMLSKTAMSCEITKVQEAWDTFDEGVQYVARILSEIASVGFAARKL